MTARKNRQSFRIDGKRIFLRPGELSVFSILYNRRGRPCSAEDIAGMLCENDPEGGPLDPVNLARNYIYRLRKKLQATQFKIDTIAASAVFGSKQASTKQDWVGGYKLARLEQR